MALPLLVASQDTNMKFPAGSRTLIYNMPDSRANSIIMKLQGVWAGPDETYYFKFRGDSVKEWESEGADSSQKPYCSYVLSKVSCDSISKVDTGGTGYYLFITCTSPDNVETRCYSILSVDSTDLKIGYRGKYDETGHLQKMNGDDK